MEPSRAVRKMAEDLISAIMEEQNASHSTTRQTLDPEEPLAPAQPRQRFCECRAVSCGQVLTHMGNRVTLGIVYADDVARLHQDMLDMLDNGLRTIAQSFTNSGHEEGHDRYQYRALQDLFWRSGLPVHFDQNWTPEPMPMAVHMISPPEPSFGNCFTYNYNPPFQEPASVNGNQYLTPPVQDSRHHCDVYPEAHPRPPFQDQGFNSINNVLTTPANHHPGAASEYYALQGHQGGRSETENTLDRMMFKHRSKQICENVHEAVLETVYQLVRFRGIRL